MRAKLGAVLMAALVVSVAPMAATATPPPGPLAGGDDLAEALDLEAKINDHLVWDQVVPIRYGSDARTPGDVVDAFAWGDSGLWTGVYLGSQSFRYALARDYLGREGDDEVTGEERDFWIAQRDEAKARVDRMVDKFHLLANIGSTWRTEFALSTDPNAPSFGGGVIQGEPGMLMRACAPTDAPAKWDMGPNKRVFEFPSDPAATWEDGKRYFCETAPSRDTYAGTTFGLLTAFDLVGPDDPELRQQIGADVLTLANFLLKYGWNFPRPHGNISAPPNGHDFDNFASPLFTYVPMARLNLTLAARHVAAIVGPADQATKWDAVWAEELATQGPLLGGSMEVDAAEPNNGYYKFNLHHLTGFNTVRLADPTTRPLFTQAMGVMDATTGDDINAHFEAITYALTGESRRLDDALLHLRQWRDYRARTDLGGETNNQVHCGVTIECVPNDQWDAVVAGQLVTTKPGTSGLRARGPLAVADRPPTDFLWQRPPTQLNGSTEAAVEEVGHDYLLPYWLLRYYTEVARPALSPFPAWPGPAHR
jgi:hypothetical protein